ncbi:hypothetical protein Ccrd_012047 [Cynara cardunculus var. scolymus]|uniref:Diphthine--ammonia ligase n=1 Tax=Cynara cardunculus var. scolymus TaxID=59895 RepID=A0A103YI73_CYNCS|nr:hypothetical protein Ccrd_012047 [Cynara cardunculus var. scolymus]
MMKCVQYGHEVRLLHVYMDEVVVALANLLPADDAVDELDSYMYQTVGHQIVVSYAKCMGVPLRHDLSYKTTPGDEVEDMYILLKEVKKQIPAVTAVSSGAIASDYQRLRVENVCSRLGLISLAYLWKLDQSLLLQEMIETGIFAITVKVAAIGLDPSKHLGKEMSYLWPHLLKLKEYVGCIKKFYLCFLYQHFKLYGSNVCGEGGEYETLTLDCPLFEVSLLYARIVLDEFQLVLQSSNSIAPVGFLHPLAFHCEDKPKSVCVSDSNRSNGFSLENMESVIEVQNECLEIVEEKCRPSEVGFDLAELEKHRPHISKTRKENIFSMSCWLQGSSETSDKCRFGVPSRSTIELPLSQVGLGRAYVEVLVTNDQSKKVLHVQSISSWAPSCIGPYSQATLHKEILYMAGQLGLDPSTMSLCSGGPAAELEQSLLNSEAVAKCFNCSISTSTILFVIYCSESTSTLDRISMQEKHNAVLSKMKLLNLDQRLSGVLDQFFLYVLVPDLPKRAFVEVKPILFVEHDRESVEIVNNQVMSDLKYNVNQFDSCFQPEIWHDECLQKCLVHGRICAVILSITTEIAKKICSDKFISANADDLLIITAEEKMERAAKFCVYLIFKTTFDEFAKTTKTMTIRKEPIFNVVPVIGVGSSAASMDDIVTCELFATKS